jgi:hemoglobin-like flavoprotein
MTPRQIALVQESFRLVQPTLETAAAAFYDRLFELDPSLRRMFRTSRDEQARKLAQALTVVVKAIDRPDQIRGAVESLGRRHSTYGVQDQHYATVGAALLWTLEAGLGTAFTPGVRDAWTAAYSWLADTMQRAAAMTAEAETTLHAVAVASASPPQP